MREEINNAEADFDIDFDPFKESPAEEQESPDPYGHAEHCSDRGASPEGSESSFEVKFEGNCAWKGGCIIGYSSDCDFS